MIVYTIERPHVLVPGAPIQVTLRGECACGRAVAMQVVTHFPRITVAVRCPSCGIYLADGREAANLLGYLLPDRAPDDPGQ